MKIEQAKLFVDLIGQRVKLTKLQESDTAEFKNNIQTGAVYIGGFIKEPTLGESFVISPISVVEYNRRGLRTSFIKEIIDENTFRTNNSIYRWEKID